jgi:hypothetical protein
MPVCDARFGPQKAEAQSIGLERDRVVHLNARVRVLSDVAAGLVEELPREHDVFVVEQMDLAEIGHVRHAVLVAGGDDARDDAVEATRDLGEIHWI